MDKVEVKPTWQLAWGLWWRIFLIGLGIYLVILLPILLIAGITAIPWQPRLISSWQAGILATKTKGCCFLKLVP